MFRQTLFAKCTFQEVVHGVREKYRPKFRPTRLTMPSEFGDASSLDKRPLHAKERVNKQRLYHRRGSIKLGQVSERLVTADVFQYCLKHLDTLSGMPETPNPTQAPSDDAAEPAEPLQAAITPLQTNLWEALRVTPANRIHGLLSHRGKAVTDGILLSTIHRRWPRLTATHVSTLQGQCNSLAAAGDAAMRLRLAEVLNLETDCGMWEELSVLLQNQRELRNQLRMDPEEMQHVWKSSLRYVDRKVNKFPVAVGKLQPRMEWLRAQLYAFIGFADVAEGRDKVRALVHDLFMEPLEPRVISDEEREEWRRAQVGRVFRSISGMGLMRTHAPFIEKELDRHPAMPPALVSLISSTPNPLKEVQLVLKYSGSVPVHIKGKPLVARALHDALEEVTPIRGLRDQRGKQVKVISVGLYAGDSLLGEGTGVDEASATHRAATHALMNYYFKQP